MPKKQNNVRPLQMKQLEDNSLISIETRIAYWEEHINNPYLLYSQKLMSLKFYIIPLHMKKIFKKHCS